MRILAVFSLVSTPPMGPQKLALVEGVLTDRANFCCVKKASKTPKILILRHAIIRYFRKGVVAMFRTGRIHTGRRGPGRNMATTPSWMKTAKSPYLES